MATIISPFITDTLDYTDARGALIRSFPYTLNLPQMGDALRQRMKPLQEAADSKDLDRLAAAYQELVSIIFGDAGADLIAFYSADGALAREAFVSDMAEILTHIILPAVSAYQKGRVAQFKARKNG